MSNLDNIVGATFLGCSVANFNTAIGWSDNGRSRLTVTIVEDDGQTFTFPNPGSYAKFQYGDTFVFEGIITDWEEDRSSSGYPIYNVTLEDPHIILQTVQVIVGGYAGPKLNIPNLLDAFGYYERNQFNSAETNDAGMPFTKIYDAVNALIANGEINFLGTVYTLDWSDVAANIPQYFRIGGGYVTSLLDIIKNVCQVSNKEFIVKLENRTNIIITTIDLTAIPGTDNIRAFVAANEGSVEKWKRGLELANSGPAFQTAGVVFGDIREDLERLDQIEPFWGFNTTELSNSAQVAINSSGITNFDKVYLDGLQIYNVINQRYYPATILELKCVLAGYDVWTTYLEHFEPNKLQTIAPDYLGMYYDAYGRSTGKYKYLKRPSAFFNTNSRLAAKRARPRYEKDVQVARLQQVYRYLQSITQQYFGRAYAVAIPFNIQGLESETFRLKWSRETAQSGWSDNVPINMDSATAEFFKDELGKYVAILVFDKQDIDLRYLKSDWAIVGGIGGFDDLGAVGPLGGLTSLLNSAINTQSEYVYVKCELGTDIFLQDGIPCCLAMMPDAIFEKEEAPGYGKLADLLAFFPSATSTNLIANFKKNGLPYNTFKIHPGMVMPRHAYIPLRNNTTTYGPWTFGTQAGGAVFIEQNNGLTPWNYGSTGTMDAVGQQFLFGQFTSQIFLEKGEVTMAGTPVMNLGDQILGYGPVVTSISVEIGAGGARTTYRFETYTPRFGQLDRYRLQRLADVGLENAKISRKLLQGETKARTGRGGIPLGQQIKYSPSRNNIVLGTIPTKGL